ncbi:hypothetical protein CASFOL_016962 [Castilleja foliolosa]|uniref:Uncharacterized protein n=1 Tax=Castilleja foliolosa TaxID=1961234 RepID=A0ABD3DDW2_9LAMI
MGPTFPLESLAQWVMLPRNTSLQGHFTQLELPYVSATNSFSQPPPLEVPDLPPSINQVVAEIDLLIAAAV